MQAYSRHASTPIPSRVALQKASSRTAIISRGRTRETGLDLLAGLRIFDMGARTGNEMRIMLTAAMLLAPAMTGAATTPAATPNAMMTLGAAGAVRPKLPKMAAVQPVPVTAKLALLRNKGIVVRDLPTGPPKVTVAKPVVPGLSLSFYGIFAVSADMDIAMQQDEAGFFAINWSYEPGRAYLVDCEMSGPATVETSSEGSGWLPETRSPTAICCSRCRGSRPTALRPAPLRCGRKRAHCSMAVRSARSAAEAASWREPSPASDG